uniref:Uncharacterized protein n=1 Tax=Lactuca sativa TaxID=4236 RepID=A0A9R1WVT1_LACSA|nr:hypothetical protein LSAT_V11C800426740 [Lactuca sativa]
MLMEAIVEWCLRRKQEHGVLQKETFHTLKLLQRRGLMLMLLSSALPKTPSKTNPRKKSTFRTRLMWEVGNNKDHLQGVNVKWKVWFARHLCVQFQGVEFSCNKFFFSS